MMAGQHVPITKHSGQSYSKVMNCIGDKCVSSYPINDSRHIGKITWPNHYKLLELNVNLRSSSVAKLRHPFEHHTQVPSQGTYTRGGCGGDSGLLSLVLFPWKRHNKC
jgi:hypothetical protein